MENQQVQNALQNCELQLRECLADAASAGDYEAVKQITRIVTSVASLATSSSKPDPPSRVSRSSHSKRKSRKASKYPVFSKRGDDLIKTGWSKKEKSTYDHKANKSVVSLLVGKIFEVAGTTGVFTTDKLFPLSESGEEVPAYQGYICLAWLKDTGIVTADGRSGYRVIPDFTNEQQVWGYWTELQNYNDLRKG